MICPQCGQHNKETSKFCNECGTHLEIDCPRCSKINPPENKFCNGCGQALTPLERPTLKSPPSQRAAPSREGEREPLGKNQAL
jgi:uncharacterized membrane protein YvbJ